MFSLQAEMWNPGEFRSFKPIGREFGKITVSKTVPMTLDLLFLRKYQLLKHKKIFGT